MLEAPQYDMNASGYMARTARNNSSVFLTETSVSGQNQQFDVRASIQTTVPKLITGRQIFSQGGGDRSVSVELDVPTATNTNHN